MTIPTLAQLQAAFSQHGYRWPSEAHVVVLRKVPGTLDAFDDMLIFVSANGQALPMRCTADPGKVSLDNPKRADGCAVQAVGQSTYTFGKHHGQYECLVPVGQVPVLRYTSSTDTTGTPSTSSTVQIHRANEAHESTVVANWSEGCTVIANPKDFAALMGAAKNSGQHTFLRTLIEWSSP